MQDEGCGHLLPKDRSENLYSWHLCHNCVTKPIDLPQVLCAKKNKTTLKPLPEMLINRLPTEEALNYELHDVDMYTAKCDFTVN